MRNGSWVTVAQRLDLLAYMVKDADEDGLDLYFSTSLKREHSKKASELTEIVLERPKKPKGGVNIRKVLESILDDFRTSVHEEDHTKSFLGLRKAKKRKAMTCYILTDGAWSRDEHCDLEPVIKKFVDALIKLDSADRDLGIQFISFGNDRWGLETLEYLDSSLGLQR